MVLNFDSEKIKEAGKALSEEGRFVGIAVDNMQWELGLPGYEAMMIRQAKSDYEFKVSGLSEEEYSKYVGIKYLFCALEDFYDEEKLERTKRELRAGFLDEKRLDYDVNLTIDEAYQKYCPVDRHEAARIYRFMRDIERKGILYEQGVREQYTGDLATQIGYDKAEYQEKEKAENEAFARVYNQFQEVYDKYAKENPEKIEQQRQAFANFSEFVNRTAAEYEKNQNPEEAGGFRKA